MSMAFSSRHRPGRPARSGRSILLLAGAGVLAGAVLGGGAVGLLPPLVTIAVAVVLAAAGPAFRLIRHALSIHRATRSFGPCRGAGFLGIAVILTALTTGSLPLWSASMRALGGAFGLVVAVAVYTFGLFMLPGMSFGPQVRLRRALDGLSVGVSLSFVAYVLLPAGGPIPPAALLAALAVTVATPAVALNGLRSARQRRAALLCASGAELAVLGLAGTVAMIAYGAPEPALLLPAAPIVAGPLLVWAGAQRVEARPPALSPTEADGAFAGYPVLALPLGMAVLAAGYHLLTGGEFDHTSILLAIGVSSAMVTREALAVVDVRRYAARLVTQEAHFRALVSGAKDVTMVLDEELIVRWQSPAAARQFGLSDQDVLGHPFANLLHPQDAAGVARSLRNLPGSREDGPGRSTLVEARLRDGFGRWRDTESTVSDQRATPEVGALVIHLRDVGERKHLERTLHQLTFTDQLTGLANRRELTRTVAARLGRGGPGPSGALLVIDLHGMTGVNDLRGRDVGDAVLIEVAVRLRAVAGQDDLVARLSGDQFGMVTAEGPVPAYALGTRLLAELTRPYELPGATVHLHTSIGLADLGADDSVDDVLSRADLARRRARQLGRDRVEWYDESLEEQLVRRLDLERELPGAAGRGELDLVYQPIVDLTDGRPVGLEALLRWRNPVLGTILPAEVIPVAEQLGVVGEVGDWVLRTACRQMSRWLRDERDVWLAVNVSVRQLADPGFVGSVARVLAAHATPPERLLVEIAESQVGADLPNAVTQLAGLRALGVRTALDGFGAGQASLAHLRRLPVDVLKVDSALFVDPAGRQGAATSMVDVVVGLGRRLGVEIVAEGLESAAHRDLVVGAGCRYGQGYLLGRPAPAEHIEAYLEEHRTPSL
ncbi:putative bifunctional diguanylate cyclase/phosphodiesterase [Rhizomonospora bruguierae]|uniref:putative bifunctional diguanylate cyclase/phosphodiesterase n=1 Tax=Rhizomonospora bruguierae TaxID=1581705 RepID=UPI0020C0A6E3|nr:EAL domain-containing protein [Micromonospora sp. NBRC 107566]